MGKLRKIGKKIGSKFKKIGKKLMKGFGKVAKVFGKLGPLGSIALSFIIPGMGGWLSSLAGGNSILAPVANALQTVGGKVTNGIGKVFNRVTDAVEWSMNAVSKPFMEGARGAGSAFRDFVSNVTGGFIDRSTVGLRDNAGNLLSQDTISAMSPEDLTKLQDRNLAERQINKFESSRSFKKNLEGTDYTKRFNEEKGAFEYLKEGAEPDDVFKTITDKSSEGYLKNLKVADTADKPSIFAEGEYDSFKARVKASREFETYKKIAPIQIAGTQMIAEEDQALYNQQQEEKNRRAYFVAEAQSKLGPQGLTQSMGIGDGIAYYDFNVEPTQDDTYQLLSSYGGILTGGGLDARVS